MATSLPTPPKVLKIFYYSFSGIGHQNASLGFAQSLAARGHQIYFLINEAYKGRCTKYGIGEIHLHKTTEKKKQSAKEVIVQGAERMRRSGFFSGESTFEKMLSQYRDSDKFVMMKEYFEETIQYEPQIEAAIEKEKPDLIIVDHLLVPVAIQRSKIFWVYQCSFQPLAALESNGKLPPFGSGYPTRKDPSFYQEYREQWKLNHQKLFTKYQDELDRVFGYIPENSVQSAETLVPKSPYFNFYAYPKELDYQFESHWSRIDAFARQEIAEDDAFELPDDFKSDAKQKLIYLSMGTIASIDVNLMKRILAILEGTPHRYIVSKGQLADEYELPENCWGVASLPQTRILPLVDLVITHGGNNTVTETFYHGKPMIVLPFFADQYDNAQRIHETGYGIRLEPYSFTDDQLTDSIYRLLNDQELKTKLKVASTRIQKSNSKEEVCVQIEKLVEKISSNKLNDNHYLRDAFH